ncbi:MAG: hypothetical protein NTY36_12405 [Deltaproteobacteria bacterium]|nr:hypothetical protein [Deltaproteobacteria bacterium]
MRKSFWLATLLATALLSGTEAWADGDFFVVAGGGGVGTKITSVPYVIIKPGFYYLGGNLAYSGTGDAISIQADNVILDLKGFSLTGAGKAISSCGINPWSNNGTASNNVEIRNGTVSGFGAGVIGAAGSERVNRIIAQNNTYGIWVANGNPSIEGCTCSNNDKGILVGNGWIASCIANNNTDWGINLNGPGSVVGCVANNNGTGFVLAANGPTPMMVDQNSASGNGHNYNSGSNTNIAWGTNVGR